MKLKQKIDIIISLLIILFGLIILILPIFDFTNTKFLSIIIYSIYTILGGIKFLFEEKTKDYDGIYLAISSVIPLIITIIFKPETSRQISLILSLWIILVSISKLKKIDYYHDRRDRMWKVRTFILGLFILTGLISSVNLAFSNPTQIIAFGYLTFIHGILELFDPILKYLLNNS